MKQDDLRTLIGRRLEQAQTALEEARLLKDAGRSTLGLINRAYYAMFYATLALLLSAGKTPRKHSGALALFDAAFVKPGAFPKSFSKKLHDAFDLRQNSDYHAMGPTGTQDGLKILDDAEAFVQAVKNHLEGQGNG